MVKQRKIFICEAALAAQGCKGITEANPSLRLDCACQNFTNFGLGTAPMLRRLQTLGAMHVVGQISYRKHSHSHLP
jgi:hypothetical protein